MIFFKGKLPAAQIPTEWRTMEDSCTEKMKKQIPIELGAAMTYMAMVSIYILKFSIA